MAVLVRVNQLIALLRCQMSHALNRVVDRPAAVGRQQSELLIELARAHLLIGSQMLPGFHSLKNALLLPRRQHRKMVQAVQKPVLLGQRQPAKLIVTFERAKLLLRRQILISAKPISSVAGRLLRRT